MVIGSKNLAPETGLRGTRASDHLDMIRGTAAVAVLYSHARVVLVASAAGGMAPVNRVLMLLSGYGHSAVVIFFVLSGYLVGGGVVRATATGKWSWGGYLLARCVRLYLVLVPALLLTAAWDRVGLEITTGRPRNTDTAAAIVTADQVAAHAGFSAFLGNSAFLQTIVVPTYGSNTPLWSLANEWWYYVIFPCLWLAAGADRPGTHRLAYFCIAAGMLRLVGFEIAALFPAWLLGVGVALIPRLRVLQSRVMLFVTAAPLAVILGLVGLRIIPHGYPAQYAVALSFAPFLLALLHRRDAGGSGLYATAATALAGCSYTLYLTHLPVLVCLRAFWTYDRPWPTDVLHWALVAAVCAGCVVYAYLLALLTEAQTDRIRRWIVSRSGVTTQPPGGDSISQWWQVWR